MRDNIERLVAQGQAHGIQSSDLESEENDVENSSGGSGSHSHSDPSQHSPFPSPSLSAASASSRDMEYGNGSSSGSFRQSPQSALSEGDATTTADDNAVAESM